MSRSIVIEVAPDGRITIRADGYIGPGCVEAVGQMAALLGVVEEEEHLPEYGAVALRREEQGTELRQGGR